MKHTRKNLRPNGKKTWPLAGLAGRVKVRVNKSISAGRRNIRIHWREDNTPGIISGDNLTDKDGYFLRKKKV